MRRVILERLPTGKFRIFELLSRFVSVLETTTCVSPDFSEIRAFRAVALKVCCIANNTEVPRQ